MIRQFRLHHFFSLFIVLFASSVPGIADDSDTTPAPAEPIDFVDIERAQPNNAMNQRQAPTVPVGWGSAIFSPDNTILATIAVAEKTSTKGEITLWSVGEMKPLFHYEQPARILVAAFSPDGKWLAIGPAEPQSGVKLLDTSTGEVGQILPGPVARTNAIAWSLDGTQLALASTVDKSVRIWNAPEKKFLKTLEPDSSSLLALAFTKDAQLLAAGVPTKDRDGLCLFDVLAGETLHTLTGHKELIEAAAFSADGTRLTSVGWDASIRTWDTSQGKEVSVLKGHKKGIRSVAISHDGNRLATSNEREFKVWDGEKKELLADLGGDNSGAKFVAISPSGAWLASITREGTAHLWDVEKKAESAKFDYQSMTSSIATKDTTAGQPATPSVNDAPEAEAIQALAYSNDGRWIALAREDGRISIRNSSDGTVAREIEAFSDVAACVTFSQDSQLIAAGSFDKSVKVWNVASGAEIAEFTGHTNWVFSVAFSPDGLKLATGSYDKTARLWNIADGKELANLSAHTAGVRSVTFTPNGQYLISGSADRTAIVWQLADLQPVATLKGHTAAVRAVACSPDGTTVATASEDATVKLWKTDDWTERATMTGTEGVMFWCLAFSHGGRTLAAGAFDGTVKLYDPVTGKERQGLRGPSDAITSLAFAPDTHELVGGSVDKSLTRWKSKSAAAAAAAAPSTRSVEAMGDSKPVEVVNALDPIVLKMEQPILSLAFTRDTKRLAVGTGLYRTAGSLQLWDVTERQRLWKGDDFKFGVSGVAFSHDEKRIAIGNFADNFLRMIDASNAKQLKEVRGHRAKIAGVACSPNGKYFATASLDRDVKLWDATTNKEVKSFSGHSDFVYSIAFSPDGKRLLSGSYDRTARLWDMESGKEVLQLKGHSGTIQQAVYSHDGSKIATASADGTARIYEATQGTFLFTLRGHRNKIETVAFSSNGKLIATGSVDRSIRIWDAVSGIELQSLPQEGIVRAIAFTPNGRWLASGCDDKTVKLWEVLGPSSPESAGSDATSR
ncbi:WD40 repeat domain-containing protein [Schlesneria paludicola]|uniref:WD40 repeat domain-containing protein n=1 Tax=Schlesneria paludicola TaxID=360056 RepID=UPI00029A1FA9|nr:WD40 repeat domain-containing protein [Schlesneria paludicola]